MNDVIREFLLETQENLAQLDLDLVTLEKEPTERETLARVFRTLHTVKGTAGFLGLMKLQAVTHSAENLLTRLTARELTFNAAIAGALLATVDAVRQMLEQIERTDTEGPGDYAPVIQTLEKLRAGGKVPRPAATLFAPAFPLVMPRNGKTAQPTQFSSIPSLADSGLSARPPVDIALIDSEFAARSGIDASEPPALPPESPLPESARPSAPAVADSTIRVDVSLLDALMTLVGELVLTRNQIVQLPSPPRNAVFQKAVQRLNALTVELQAGVMKTRMQPIVTVWNKFPRLVRDLAVACGKEVGFQMAGGEVELDRSLIEAIRDPLVHMVRNAIDHGIEGPAERTLRGKPPQGRLALNAFHEGGKVIIEVMDDGAGIDPQRVRNKALQAGLLSPELAAQMSKRDLLDLIFHPGFSTAEQVTQVSGRGVGMNVVRSNIEKVGGAVEVETCVGLGTTIRIKIPLTLAIIHALIVTSGGDYYALPQISLLEVVRLEGAQARRAVEHVHGAPVYRLRGNLLPLVYLHEQLRVESSGPEDLSMIVLKAEDCQFGLVVDGILDTEEIVVKPLQTQLKSINVFAGATIRGDGKVALILNVPGLAQRANVVSRTPERAVTAKPSSAAETAAPRQSVILFAAAGERRLAVPLAQVARLEEFPRSALGKIGNQDVVLYRRDLLPLIHVAEVLQLPDDAESAEATLQVVVHTWEGRRVGLVCGRLLDVVEVPFVSASRIPQLCLLFTTVIQGRPVEVLDLEALIRRANPKFYEQNQPLVEED